LTIILGVCIAAIVTTALFLTGCGGGGGDNSGANAGSGTDTIKVTSKNYTEQLILGNILAQLIEGNTDYNVEFKELEMTPIVQPAMERGDVDLYPEYTGTAWNEVLHEEETYHDEDFEKLAQAYTEKFNFSWVGNFYGFNDTYSIGIPKEFAEKNNIKTFSDLVPYAKDMVLGAEPDFWERDDGMPGLSKAYDLKFKKTKDISQGLKYDAIKNDEIDALIVYTTDGPLAGANLAVLEDDKKFFPSYQISTVIRNEVLEQHPDLKPVLEMMTNTIDETTMTAMNSKVAIEDKDGAEVAREFLLSKGLIKE
jgi:osmoprotectant transport system permease protein